jgi:hypothetical protein
LTGTRPVFKALEAGTDRQQEITVDSGSGKSHGEAILGDAYGVLFNLIKLLTTTVSNSFTKNSIMKNIFDVIYNGYGGRVFY